MMRNKSETHKVLLQRASERFEACRFGRPIGTVTQVLANTLKVNFPSLGHGAICRVRVRSGDGPLAQVVSAQGDQVTLSVMGEVDGITVGDNVVWVSDRLEFNFHKDLLGSILSGIGAPIEASSDGIGRPMAAVGTDITAPLERPVIKDVFQTGITAIDAFLTMGRGQRLALFGAPGTGKTQLLADIAARSSAEVVVLALVGERGREVQEFLTRHVPKSVRDRMVMVVATSDRPPLERAYAVHVASSIAEGYRDLGKNVLLIVDSITRVARALREVGLAAGEPAVRRGYPASVYPALPKIIERSGCNPKGEITAIYSVLLEGERSADPIAEEIASLTDGHIELSREMAAAGRFPAVDVLRSLSRVMAQVVSKSQNDSAMRARTLLAKYEEIELLIQIGEYQNGADPLADEAVEKHDGIETFIRSPSNNYPSQRALARALSKVVGTP